MVIKRIAAVEVDQKYIYPHPLLAFAVSIRLALQVLRWRVLQIPN